MATYQTYTSIGQREDLSDVIYSISPTDTPFMSSIGKGKATATNHEWQTDALASAVLTNAAVEGDTASDATIGVTTRVGNKTQISQKTVKISGTLEAVDKAGRKSEKSYQLAKASAEIKRDMETTLLSNQASTNGNSSTARKLGGLQTWLATNGDFGTSGVAGASGTTTRTNGTNRFMTSPNTCDEAAFVLDVDMAAVAYLRPFQTNELAKTGDAEVTQLLVEYTLQVNNEAAHGIIADLTP